jgi:hypothetical protein
MLDSTSTESRRTYESSKLAINGGTPVCQKPWPTWPQSNPATEKAVIDVLRSGRWTISGFTNGKSTQEQIFAAAFADFIGVKNCIPTDHGTSLMKGGTPEKAGKPHSPPPPLIKGGSRGDRGI